MYQFSYVFFPPDISSLFRPKHISPAEISKFVGMSGIVTICYFLKLLRNLVALKVQTTVLLFLK
jgi:hypothetical protein